MTLERRRAAVSAGEIAYVDEGDGPAVVLLHGFPTSADLWRDVAPILSVRARAIAPDLLGYGESAKPPDARLDVRAQAGYVRELLERLDVQEFAVVGHDIGGGIAQLLALEGGARAMVLLDSVCFDSWPIEGVRMIQAARDEDVDEEFAVRLVRLTFDLGMGHRERLSEQDLETAYLRPWREDPLAVVRAARAIDGEGLVGTERALEALDLRSLIVWGEDDPFQPAELAERLQNALPMSTVALLPGCSHFVTEDAAETVAPLIVDYLGATYLGGHDHGGHDHETPAGPVPVDLGVSFQRPNEPPVDPD